MRFTSKNLFPLAIAAVLVACGDSASAPADAVPTRPAEPLPPLPSLPDGLTVRLTPRPDRSALDVEVHLVGPAAARAKELAIARDWAGIDGMAALRGIRVRDGEGVIPTDPGPDEGPDRTLVLGRAPTSHLAITYGVASAPKDAARFALHLDRERLSGVGHTFLLLPRTSEPLAVHVQIRPGALAPGASGASSFGVGDDVEDHATPADLANAVYLAGRLRTLDSAEKERLVLLGRPAFEPEATLASISRAHAALARLFGGAPRSGAKSDDFSYLLVAEPGLGKGHDGALLGRSFGLWIGDDRPFDAAVTIAAAHELSHRWIGGAVRLVAEGREQVWFSEGFSVHYARKIAFAEKLISGRDFAADLERTLVSAEADLPAHARSRKDYQRGALYAAVLDAALRKASGGERSLDDLVRALLDRAATEKNADLPVSALGELVARELGPARGEELDWVMVRGHGEITLDEGAFGPCFHRARTKSKVYELGFDEASLRRTPAMIRGLVAGSAAARAGLEEGALVLSSKVPAGRDEETAEPVEIVVADRGRGRKIRFVPVAERQVVRWAEKPRCRD
ncbi:hypothetical protein [Polyangium sp. y55x31]|uniref:hypothetical protein n=1 Tax=Polyangium sp. y55x31 TaxID=3042688 RepID=UPI0024830035|nr:hypothetical protein [Polyangium sp. y55x31]MDI1479038.1 hypothetical protein [Polyangium sp. y55x31]